MDYWYDAQLRKFIKQFMAIFSTFSVKISEDAATQVIRKLPTVYGGSSRMVQSIIRNNSENMANTVVNAAERTIMRNVPKVFKL